MYSHSQKPCDFFQVAKWLIALVGYFAVTTLGFAKELPLQRIQDLRYVSRADAALRPQVKVSGIISSISPGAFTLESESIGIWVSLGQARDLKIWQGNEALLASLHQGSEIELEGLLDPGMFAPTILPQKLVVLGEKELPPPKIVPLDQFLSGATDVQRVQVSGVVQSVVDVSCWRIMVETGLGFFITQLDLSSRFKPEDLMDARVRISGIAISSRNVRGEIIYPHLSLQHESDLVIEKAPPDDPFAAPKRPISQLKAFSPDGRPLHRQCIEGMVIYQSPEGVVHVQAAGYGVRVETITRESFTPGDQVEVAGFINIARGVAGLTGAMIRKVGNTKSPIAEPINLTDIQKDHAYIGSDQPLDHPGIDGLLVSIKGNLLGQQGPSSDGVMRLEIDTGDSISTAFVREKKLDVLPGSELRVTGVAQIQYAPVGQINFYPVPTRLDLLMRDKNDLTILSAPSWWNARRLYGAMSILALALAIGGLWIYQLRRLVDRQTKRWEQTLFAHRDSELEMKGAREERYRLAGDLHDGLQQHLTGASYRLEAALLRLGHQAPDVEEQFTATRAALERTRTGLRECLLGLRVVEEGPSEFSALLRHAAEKMEHWPKNAVEIAVTGEPFPLTRHVMGTLLLLMQEAVGNAFKHGAASKVQVALCYFPNHLEMHIDDNGNGFDPTLAPNSSAGHFGIESMRHRLHWLGGNFELHSRPNAGTQLIAVLSKKNAEDSANATDTKNPFQ